MVLDVDIYTKIRAGDIFASGIIGLGDVEYWPQVHKDIIIKWIAIKINTKSWQIMLSNIQAPNNTILLLGKKVVIPADIQLLVPCDADVFKLYNRQIL